MRKNVFIPKRILRVFPLGLLFMLVGLTSCNSELNSSIIGCYSAIVQAFGYDMEIVYDGDSTNVPLEVRKLGDDIKAIGAQIVSAPEDVSGSQPGFGCRVNFLVSGVCIKITASGFMPVSVSMMAAKLIFSCAVMLSIWV